MHNLRSVLWSQGLFLTPQHLQQSDLFHLTSAARRWQIASPYNWGLRELKVRDEGLAASQFEVQRLELVTRSGELIVAGSESEQANASIQARSFEGLVEAAKGPVNVYLAVPKHQPGQANVSASASTEQNLPLRYSIHAEDKADVYDPGVPEVKVALLRYNLSVLFQGEARLKAAEQSAELIRVAQLEPRSDGQGGRLSSKYVPPCLTVASSRTLYGLLQTLRDVLSGKANEFAAIRRQRGVRATAHVAQEAIRLQMLQTLSRYVPLMHHLLETGYSHPEAVYGLLRQLVGELSVFSEEVGVLGAVTMDGKPGENLPAYNHEDMWPGYAKAITIAQQLVRTMTTGADAGYKLAFDGKYFQTKLPAEAFEGTRTRYYLMIDSLVKGDELWGRLQRTGKITTLENLPVLLPRALMGLKIDPLPYAPEELPQRGSNHSYFAIDTNHPEWRMIRERGNIAMYCDLNAEETVIKLFVVKEDE
jgi:type VI secretion system ImpJ/VasE family protein